MNNRYRIYKEKVGFQDCWETKLQPIWKSYKEYTFTDRAEIGIKNCFKQILSGPAEACSISPLH